MAFADKTDAELKKYSGLSEKAKNLQVIYMGKELKTLTDPDQKELLNSAILKLATKKPALGLGAKEKPDDDKKTVDDSTSSSISGGVGKGALTMNLNITNIFKEGEVTSHDLKRKVTDIVVDAGRDALVILGNN